MSSPATAELNSVSKLLQRVDRAYSDPSWWYDLRGFFILLLAHRTTVWSQTRFFARNISDEHLEVPVGSGTLLRMALLLRRLRRRDQPRVTAVDWADAMVAASARAFAGKEHVTVQKGDVARLGFADASFRSINVANGLHCFPEPDAALRELHRVLAPGGSLAASVLIRPRGWRGLRWISRRIYGWGQRKGQLFEPFALDDVFARFRAAGFTIVESDVIGNTVELVACK